jgi:2-keto-4-pentenoate hydratase/2-oxohepta-3-ene-1,7-dioic acid hydratase in catechol pathway
MNGEAVLLFNDVPVRDYQMRTPQWTIGKNFDRSDPFGSWLMTADELPAGHKGLRLQTASIVRLSKAPAPMT